jgi:hypothetical protein
MKSAEVVPATAPSLAVPSWRRPGFCADGAAALRVLTMPVSRRPTGRIRTWICRYGGSTVLLAPPGFAGAGPHRLGEDGLNAGDRERRDLPAHRHHTRPQIQPIHESAGALTSGRALSFSKSSAPS